MQLSDRVPWPPGKVDSEMTSAAEGQRVYLQSLKGGFPV